MKITELLLAELDREAVGIRKTLERVPEGKNDWKPHRNRCRLARLRRLSPRFQHGLKNDREHGRTYT